VAAPEVVAESAPEDLSRTVYEYPVRRRLLSGDILPREALLFVPLMFLILYIGVQPDSLTTRMNSTTNSVATIVHPNPATGLAGGAR
jgi:NADH:ubiquinone oxidoreductase subunit 4 (subunit M)